MRLVRALAAWILGIEVLAVPLSARAQTRFAVRPWGSPSSAGSALGNYDNDGWPDAFRAEARGLRVALMHNESEGRFALAGQTRSIQAALPPDRLLGFGHSFADYDDDGDLDLFVPIGMWDYEQRARNLLLRNDGGQFVDVTLEAGLTDISNTDNAVWFDYDRDGHLDLYLGNPGCGAAAGEQYNLLYRNRGDGVFEDVTEAAGLLLDLGSPAREGGCSGGTNGGMAGADFDGDGWPDLYIAVFRDRNRLFLNDGQGRFVDATTAELADPGEAFDVAVGDIDNDGDLDLFQAAGGLLGQAERSLLLANLGQGRFVDITEAAGVAVVGDAQDTGFGDIDNDGDLDLTLGVPPRVWLNDGHGTFTDATAGAMPEAGARTSIPVAFWDFDLDGHLDGQGYGARTRNSGNGNHWLRVELVGTRSNRQGIGARVLAESGDLRQMREVLGGRGFNQDEPVAHFGLGSRTAVDRLEVRWPSGQVDVVEAVPADQQIRVIEGQGTFHRVEPARWVAAPPEVLVVGAQARATLAVRPASFAAGARIRGVTADLGPFGGALAVPLTDAGDGTWRAEVLVLQPEGSNGWRDLAVMIDEETSLGPRWVRLSRSVAVWPRQDLVVLDDGLEPGWQLQPNPLVPADPEERGTVYRGGTSLRLTTPSVWTQLLVPAEPVERAGYAALRFAFHPGDATTSQSLRFAARVNLERVDLTGGGQGLPGASVDLDVRDWQVVEVPLQGLSDLAPITALGFTGNLRGTFYLDDIRLVTASPPATAVVERAQPAVPADVELSPNYPNPFNGATLIPFSLPVPAAVEVAVYDALGRRVATLAHGRREPGNYQLRWDGTDDAGRPLASGVYLCRLRAADRVASRKLLLLR